MNERKALGQKGEAYAAAFFVQQGFRILQKNWNCRMGEIDLIVERDGRVHFVEVKCRLTATYGYPEEAITQTKRQHLAKAIDWWLLHQATPPTDYQADALAISLNNPDKPDIQWIQNIF